ncbi:MAG: helix-hairpin-helix domain-containing protein [Fimbriimonadaceae bacterium]
MFAHLTPKERMLYTGVAGLLLGAAGFVGHRAMRPVAPLVVSGPGVETPAPAASSDAAVPGPAPTTEVVVHVAGAVAKPGLVRVPPGSRVSDAIDSAGGARADADLESLNLAAVVEDGSQLYVPRRQAPVSARVDSRPAAPRAGNPARGPELSKVDPRYAGGAAPKQAYAAPAMVPPAPPEPDSPPRASTGSKAALQPGSINLNTASAAELERLPGIGPVTARKIVEYRQAHGGFSSIDELMAVKGIGPKKLADVRPFLRL